jgi:hypothetical protein
MSVVSMLKAGTRRRCKVSKQNSKAGSDEIIHGLSTGWAEFLPIAPPLPSAGDRFENHSTFGQQPSASAPAISRRLLLNLIAGAAALPASSHIAGAETYPSRPVRIIVGFPPGGAADITARLIGQWLSKRLAQPFMIENRPGAGTNIGTEAVATSPADGYTLLLVSLANAVNATLHERLNFDFIRDIAPVAGLVRGPLVMVLNPTAPAEGMSQPLLN